MIPTKAIELAVKGGWRSDLFATQKKPITADRSKKFDGFLVSGQGFWDMAYPFRWRYVATDAGFWLALGKELNWKYDKSVASANGAIKGEWNYYAHVFLDLVMLGEDVDKFWFDLLN